MSQRPKPWRHHSKAISVAKINAQIRAWAVFLGLADWDIRFSSASVDKGDRSSVEIDVLHRRAAVRMHGQTPHSQWDRQIVHELLHVAMSSCEDAFNIAVSELSPKSHRAYAKMWHRGQERAIEALVDAITGDARVEFGKIGEVWKAAFSE